MRKHALWVFSLYLLLILLAPFALADDVELLETPDVIRPGKFYTILISAYLNGTISLSLLNENEETAYEIVSAYPVSQGENAVNWDGLLRDLSVMEQGDYILRLEMENGDRVERSLRIGAPYPLLTELSYRGSDASSDIVDITFRCSEAGILSIQIKDAYGETLYHTEAMEVAQGENTYQWDHRRLEGIRTGGEYAFIFTLTAANGSQSAPHSLYINMADFQKGGEEAETEHITLFDQTFVTPAPSGPISAISAPYSQVGDGTFWAMNPGETDDAKIWEVLTQPITVYDDGKLSAKEHAYLMENPDGSGQKVAQLHAKSQGVHVIGEVNEHGYILVEAFSNYDRSFSPATDEERAHAFDVKQGYVKAQHLKTLPVQQDMALLIDKLTQRMYLFKDGVRVTELLISTGLITSDQDYLFETIPGEYITVSHTGTLVDENMNSAMAIRINGGILIHEVPHMLNADGTKNYGPFEPFLGTKKSHGCIRIQRKKTPEGYNQQWIWENFKKGAPYKVIIWDDLNRADTPSVWQPNP